MTKYRESRPNSSRNRYYEFFKATHFIVALLFILFFFFHCDFRLSSWYVSLSLSLSLVLSLLAITNKHLIGTTLLLLAPSTYSPSSPPSSEHI